MRLAVPLAMIAAAIAAVVRSRRGVEVWHVAADVADISDDIPDPDEGP